MIERIEEALIALLSDPSPVVREAASEAIDRTRAKRSLESFRQRLRGDDSEDKIRAVYAAGEIGGAEGVSLLLEALCDASEEVRGVAARTLGQFPSPPVLKALWERLPKEQGVVLGNLVEALGVSGRRELAPHVEKYMNHPDGEVRAKAVVAFSRLTDAAGWEKIIAICGDPEDNVRAAAAAALGNWTTARP
jgi:HEAT repeat protein